MDTPINKHDPIINGSKISIESPQDRNNCSNETTIDGLIETTYDGDDLQSYIKNDEITYRNLICYRIYDVIKRNKMKTCSILSLMLMLGIFACTIYQIVVLIKSIESSDCSFLNTLSFALITFFGILDLLSLSLFNIPCYAVSNSILKSIHNRISAIWDTPTSVLLYISWYFIIKFGLLIIFIKFSSDLITCDNKTYIFLPLITINFYGLALYLIITSMYILYELGVFLIKFSKKYTFFAASLMCIIVSLVPAIYLGSLAYSYMIPVQTYFNQEYAMIVATGISFMLYDLIPIIIQLSCMNSCFTKFGSYEPLDTDSTLIKKSSQVFKIFGLILLGTFVKIGIIIVILLVYLYHDSFDTNTFVIISSLVLFAYTILLISSHVVMIGWWIVKLFWTQCLKYPFLVLINYCRR